MIHHPCDTAIFALETVVVAAPVAGVDWTYTIPSRTRTQLVSLMFSIVTDATVVDRTIRVQFYDGTQTFLIATVTQVIAASLTRHFNLFIGGPPSLAVAAGETYTAPLPDELFLNPGDRIRTAVRAMVAGDQLTSAMLRFKKWIQVQ